MNYLITGGAGFIGSHLAETLIAYGHHVTVLDDLSTGDMNNIRHLLERDRFHFTEGAVENSGNLQSLVTWSDTVFHLAATVGVELVVKEPVRTIQTNVHATEKILECAGQKHKRVVLASTSEVYGRAASEVFRETDDLLIGPPTHSRWAYAASKALDEYLALAYQKEGKIETTIVRFFNTVGPRQTGRYGMVLPRFVSRALQNEPLEVYGTGNQSRCFCHVADTVEALLALENARNTDGEIVNIGSTDSVTINQLAERVKSLLNSHSEVRHIPYNEAYEPGFEDMPRRMPDIDKIHKITKWQPQRSLDDIILEVASYFKNE